MPNQLDPSKKRVTYAEFSDVYAALEKLAAKDRTEISTTLRQITQDFVLKHKAKKWKPVPYSNTVRTVRRITYAEWNDILEYIGGVAKSDRVETTLILRKIVYAYLVNHKYL